MARRPLTPLQKVLLVNGGPAHRFRKPERLAKPPKKTTRRNGRGAGRGKDAD